LLLSTQENPISISSRGSNASSLSGRDERGDTKNLIQFYILYLFISLEGDGFPSITFCDGYPYYAQEAILYPMNPSGRGRGIVTHLQYGNPAGLKTEICTFETLISEK
jgi:hypothetical protein